MEEDCTVIQVNGRIIDKFEGCSTLSEEEVVRLAKMSTRVTQYCTRERLAVYSSVVVKKGTRITIINLKAEEFSRYVPINGYNKHSGNIKPRAEVD